MTRHLVVVALYSPPIACATIALVRNEGDPWLVAFAALIIGLAVYGLLRELSDD